MARMMEPEFSDEQIERQLKLNPAERARWQSIKTQTLRQRATQFATRLQPDPSPELVRHFGIVLLMFEEFYRAEYKFNRFHCQMCADKLVDEHIALPSILPPLDTNEVLAEAESILGIGGG